MEDTARNDDTPRLEFPQLERVVASARGETLYQSARRHGVRIVGACGGRGTCGSCMVRVVEGAVEPHAAGGRPAPELALDDEGRPLNRAKWMRSCQVGARSDCVVEIAPRSLAPVVRTEPGTGRHERLALDAAVRAHDVRVPLPSLADDRADADRVAQALGLEHAAIDPAAACDLAAVLRGSDARTGARVGVEAGAAVSAEAGAGVSVEVSAEPGALRVWVRDNELIAFGPPRRRSLGLAVDLGTTNIAAFLIDLDSGEQLAHLGLENPQTAWGADLVSRINHATADAGVARALREAVVEGIGALAHDLCAGVGQKAADIVDVTVCGNTAMHHLLLGLPVRQLGRAPFVAVVREAVDVRARDLGLAIAPGAWVHVAPNIGGFVGGDHVTALLATESEWREADCALVVDVGTNTEISLIHRGAISSASAPSGPALEGGHVSCGMRAAEGAIEKVGLADGRLVSHTIGDGEAVGLCGSGVLDTLAVLLRGGLVSAQGRLASDHPDIVVDEQGRRAAQLAPGVLFTQDDVRAVQLAKAAIRTSTSLLLAEAGLAEDAVQRFVIAGSFGAYIDVASGVDIGLFPPLARERFVQVGNAAGLGVRRMLASRADRERARELARRAHATALNARPDFQKTFLKHIGFDRITATRES